MKKLFGLIFLFKFHNAIDLISRRLFSKYRDVSIYDLKVGPTILDRGAGDQNSIWACLDWGEYDAALDMVLSSFNFKNSISVLDCGANSGGFGLLLANRGLKFREYHAVEMNPRTFGRASFNLTNWRGQFPARVINAAVCNQTGWLRLPDIFGDTGQSIHQNTNHLDECFIFVPRISISELLCPSAWPLGLPELIKIDIEGSEFDIITQFNINNLCNTNYIIIEIHSNRNFPPNLIIDHFFLLNFNCTLRPPNNLNWGVYVFSKFE